jgi:hypothetical protein
MKRGPKIFVVVACVFACGRTGLDTFDEESSGPSATGGNDSGAPSYVLSDAGPLPPGFQSGSDSGNASDASRGDGGRRHSDAGPALDSGSEGDSGNDSGSGSDGGVECETAGDCSTLLGPLFGSCLTCPDGHEGCEHYVCLSGVCQTTYCGGSSTSGECESANDCETLLGPLPILCVDPCPDGHVGCEHYLCLSGLCQTSYCN